jgi:hypothetical protein
MMSARVGQNLFVLFNIFRFIISLSLPQRYTCLLVVILLSQETVSATPPPNKAKKHNCLKQMPTVQAKAK